jgi:GTP-binding protein
MTFVDEYNFIACAGNGGDGVVRFRREKFRPKGGPSGGDGGKGGNVYIRAVRDIHKLSRMRHVHEYAAENGFPGEDNSKTGKGGKDVYIELPIGSCVAEIKNGAMYELLDDEQEVLLLSGGVGGFGNEHFKSASNQAPREYTKGACGERGEYHVELRIIADVGFIGMPNAGKSSLLNTLTNAEAKVGAYPFTTIDPNLGVYYGLVLADIPGIIEGAAEGKGLGNKFLRHVMRTNTLVHCISFERDNLAQTYSSTRDELQNVASLAEKQELVLFTKSDILRDKETGHARIREFQKEMPHANVIGMVSILDEDAVRCVGDTLVHVCKTAYTTNQ